MRQTLWKGFELGRYSNAAELFRLKISQRAAARQHPAGSRFYPRSAAANSGTGRPAQELHLAACRQPQRLLAVSLRSNFPPTVSIGHSAMSHGTTSTRFLNACRESDYPTSLGSLFQSSVRSHLLIEQIKKYSSHLKHLANRHSFLVLCYYS